MTVPVRAALVGFAASVSETVPLPLPPAPTVIHGVADDAVHAQPAAVLTETLAVDACADVDTLVVDSVNEQAGAACVTVNACPPAVIVAEREALVAFACTAYARVAGPEPVAALVIESQGALLDAVHVHAEAVPIATEPVAAPAPSETADGENE